MKEISIIHYGMESDILTYKIKENGKNILFAYLWNKLGSPKFNEIHTIGKRSQEKEGTQSYVEIGSSRKSINKIKRNRTQTIKTWWKRYRDDKTSKNTIRGIEKTQRIYDPRTANKNTSKSWKWLPHLLQSGSWFRRIKDWYRSGWLLTQFDRTSEARYKKRYVLRKLRVEDIKVQERRNFKRSKQCSPRDYVYNIGVADNHNYFVNDILVHNSVYVTFGNFFKCMTQEYQQKYDTPRKKVDWVLNYCKKFQDKLNNKWCEEIYNPRHGKNVHEFELETISYAQICIKKKKYLKGYAYVKGKYYDTPKVSGTGIEIINHRIYDKCFCKQTK